MTRRSGGGSAATASTSPQTTIPLLSDRVESDLQDRLTCLVRHGHDVVVDFSFWQRASRDRYKQLVEAAGGTWRLIYLNVDVAELRRRLRERNSRFDANAAFPITDELLDKYLDSFEEPQGEGEELVRHGRPITDPVDHHRGIDHDAVHDRSR